MVQAWYQGGISIFDWTDASNPREIAFFDRGPLSAMNMQMAGSWSVYWYNGVIVSSEIARGLDIMELVPSAYLTQNEIDAAKTVHFDHFNPQMQRKIVWPPSFSLSRAYLDQLERTRGMSMETITAARAALTRAEGASGSVRGDALSALAREVGREARGADAARVRLLELSLQELAAASR
jgi:hypothetical protein